MGWQKCSGIRRSYLEEYKAVNTLDISYTRIGGPANMRNFINAVLEHKENTGDIKNFSTLVILAASTHCIWK